MFQAAKQTKVFQDVVDQIQEAIITHEKKGKAELERTSIDLLRDVGIPSPEERLRDYPHQYLNGPH